MLLTWGQRLSKWERPREGKDLRVVEDDFGIEGSSERRMTSGRSDVAEAPSWTLKIVDFLAKVLGSRDMCYHPGEGQILTITDAPASPLIGACKEKSRKRSTRDGCFKSHHDVCATNLYRSLRIFCN